MRLIFVKRNEKVWVSFFIFNLVVSFLNDLQLQNIDGHNFCSEIFTFTLEILSNHLERL